MMRFDPLFLNQNTPKEPDCESLPASPAGLWKVAPRRLQPFKQPHPLMTVLQAQLDWNAADTRRRRVQYRCWGRPFVCFFVVFFPAIKRINCKRLCRRNEQLPISSHHFILDSQAHFSHEHRYLFNKNCSVELAECFYQPPLSVLWLFLKHNTGKKKKGLKPVCVSLNMKYLSHWESHAYTLLLLYFLSFGAFTYWMIEIYVFPMCFYMTIVTVSCVMTRLSVWWFWCLPVEAASVCEALPHGPSTCMWDLSVLAPLTYKLWLYT